MLPTDRLAELVNKKHQVLVQLRDVGRQQMEIIERGETARLLKLLAAKQHLIAALQRNEQELAPYRLENPDERSWPSAEGRARCAEQANACNELLEEVMALEKEGTAQMTARRDRVAKQLQQVHAADQVRGAYQAHHRHGPPAPLGNSPASLSPTAPPGLDVTSEA